ncbi:MAG: tetratricopeptide repeat protein, partial [Bacteroidia bacterium]
MKYFIHILLFSLILAACTGSKKYFKAAEKLEKMGLVNEAAEFYMESLQRKTTNVDARIKLKEVGQKYVSFMSSEFFRSYNTGRYEESIEDYEKMKSFTDKAERLNVKLNYPPNYEEDYKKAVDKYCEKNYLLGENLVKEKKYNEALTYLKLVNNYQPEYRKVRDLTITASCEPSYKNAISAMENKSYSQAITHLNNIHKVTPDYKDTKELSEICNALLAKSLLMFQPKTTQNNQLVEELFNSFSQTLMNEHKNIELINNSPFVNLPGNNIEG